MKFKNTNKNPLNKKWAHSLKRWIRAKHKSGFYKLGNMFIKFDNSFIKN